MKERTEIDTQNLHFTYMELASCKVYDDAKMLLDELVIKEIGREYGDNYYYDEETDEWLCKEIKYKNSQVPRIVKLAVIDSITGFLNNRELISEEATIAYEKAKVKDTTIIPFKRMDDDAKKVRNWVERWKKEPVPKIIQKKSFRLRPKSNSVIQNIGNVFDYLVKIGRIDTDSKEMWNYLCGVIESIEVKKPIIWHGEWTTLTALIEVFLCDKNYFEFEKGVRKYFICDNMFINDKGKYLTEDILGNTKQQSNGNGTLDDEKKSIKVAIEQAI